MHTTDDGNHKLNICTVCLTHNFNVMKVWDGCFSENVCRAYYFSFSFVNTYFSLCKILIWCLFFYNSSYFSLFLTAFELWYLFSSLHTKNQMFLIMLTILMLTCNLFYSKIEFSVIDSDIVSVLFFCHKSLVQRTIYLYYKWQVNVHLFLLPWAST